MFALCLIGILTSCVGHTLSSHNDLFIEPELKQAAAVLGELCVNFEECGIEKYPPAGQLCCLNCSCDPSCTITHSCCPESGYMPTSGEESYTSGTEGMVCRNGVRIGRSLGVFLHWEYEFLERCPIGTESDLKYNCEKTYWSNNVYLLESLPLYDSLQGINYANTYCAMCNNASNENLVPWGPSVTCKDPIDSYSMTIPEIEAWLSTNECTLLYEPPDVDLDHTLCFRDVIAACNVTGRWASYDAATELYCNLLDMLYVSVDDHAITYKNIFCAMCNGEELDIAYMQFCPFPTANDYTTRFTTILKFTVDDIDRYTGDQVTTADNANVCHGNFAFDPFMRRCMPVYCSTPDILDVQVFQCKTLFGKITKVTGSHTFSVLFSEAVNFSVAQDKALEIATTVRNAGPIVCTVSIIYQTLLPAFGSLDDVIVNETSDEITGLYVNLRYFILNEFPQEARVFVIHAMENVFENDTLYEYKGPGTFDAGMLLVLDDKNLNLVNSSDDISVFKLTGPSHYLIRNPYDEQVLVSEKNSWDSGCTPGIYKDQYLPCPAFRYNITWFSKSPSGLMLTVNGVDVVFGFDEFKTASPDSTEVSICCQAVIEKVAHLFSRQRAIAPSIYVVTFLLALIPFSP